MITARLQVEKAIAKGTKNETVQSHIDYVKEKWSKGIATDLDLQFSYDIICDNS